MPDIFCNVNGRISTILNRPWDWPWTANPQRYRSHVPEMFQDSLGKIDLFSLKSGYAVQIKTITSPHKVYWPYELQEFFDEYITQYKLNNVTLDLSLFNFNTVSPESFERMSEMRDLIKHSPAYSSKFYLEWHSAATLPHIKQVHKLALSKFHSSLEEYFISVLFQPFVEMLCCFLPFVGYVLLMYRFWRLFCTVKCLYSKTITYLNSLFLIP
jgi:hypothetical protein